MLLAAALLTLSFGAVPREAVLREAAPLHAVRGDVTITELHALTFGDLLPGESAQIGYAAAGAAAFKIELTNVESTDKDLDITLTLPTHIVGAQGSLPVSFGTTSAAWNTTNNVSTANAFNPHTGVRLRMPSGLSGTFYVWVGASTSAGAAAPSGPYTETLTLHVRIL